MTQIGDSRCELRIPVQTTILGEGGEGGEGGESVRVRVLRCVDRTFLFPPSFSLLLPASVFVSL
jgi:hypothetical protein